MSIDIGSLTADCKAVHTSLDQICASQDESERFFLGVFDRLEELTEQLVRRQKAWLGERQEIESRLEQRLADLEREKAELADERERMRGLTPMLGQQADSLDGAASVALERILEEADRQREALRDAHQSAESYTERLADLASQLIDVHQELAETRAVLERRCDDLDARSSLACDPRLDEASLEKLSRLESERADWQQERAVLETELEAVRNRVAELSEALADERRTAAEERANWSGELKRMRHLLERMPERQREPEADRGLQPPPPGPGESRAESSPARPSGGDPVLDSVVAQFELLQRDLAKRRKAVPTSTSNTTKR